VTPLVDSHCHLNFEPLNTGLDDVLQRARDNGVTHMLCVSVALETFPEISQLSHRNENIYASVGVHPNEKEGHEPSVKDLVDLAKDERVVAIGETGLDYYRNKGEMGWQQERFRNHIRAVKRGWTIIAIKERWVGSRKDFAITSAQRNSPGNHSSSIHARRPWIPYVSCAMKAPLSQAG